MRNAMFRYLRPKGKIKILFPLMRDHQKKNKKSKKEKNPHLSGVNEISYVQTLL